MLKVGIASLARSRRAEYIYEYKSRIDEIFKIQEELWKIHNDENTKAPVKIMALSKIMDATMTLTSLYDSLPVVAAIGNYDEHPIVKAVREKDFSFRPHIYSPTTTSMDDSDDKSDSYYDGAISEGNITGQDAGSNNNNNDQDDNNISI